MRFFPRRKEREERDSYPLSLDQWASYFTYSGLNLSGFMPNQTLTGTKESIEQTFSGYVQGAYKGNGVVFACMLVRLLLFSEARFQFRRKRSGRPGELFGTEALSVLETPWPGGTTGDLLTRAIQDIDLAGNFFARREGDRIRRMRPDWVDIILTAPEGDLNAEAEGYVYYPGGKASSRPPVLLDRTEVAHFAPIPDPAATFRGMSPVTPVLREIMADGAMNAHRQALFENGATPNMIVKLDPSIGREAYKEWIKVFEERHTGAQNAYRTLFLGAGADATVVGANFRELDFKITQGGGETRVAAAFGVPPVIVGLSEGLQAATYSNYGQARRRFADGTMRPLWRNCAGSFAVIVNVPPGSELWYDDRDIPFLQEDQKDAAEIQQVNAATIKSLVDAGFEPDKVVQAVTSGDFAILSSAHTGLYSVQLQPPNPDGVSSVENQAGRALALLLEKHLPSTNGGKPALAP